MIKLSPYVKYGCEKCKGELEKYIKDIEELQFLIDENAPSAKQTTLKPEKPKKSSKVVSLF